MRNRGLSRAATIWILMTLMVLQPSLSAQVTAGPQAPPATTPDQFLKVYVLDGQDAVNSIPERKVTVPVVEVRDENDIPVEGAQVSFELPENGPGGTFPDRQKKRTVRTNLQGQANAPFFMNTQAGTFVIKVSASMGNRSGEAAISQTNSPHPIHENVKKPGRWYTNWKFLIIAGGTAATVLAILATRNGDNGPAPTAAPPTIVISPGSPTFGGGR